MNAAVPGLSGLSSTPVKPDAFPQPGGAVSALEGQAWTASDLSPPMCSLKAGPPMIPGVLGVGGLVPRGNVSVPVLPRAVLC